MGAVICICTRLDSRRVPRKVFQRIDGKPAIQHILDRVRHTYPIVIAVPEKCNDFDGYDSPEVSIYKGQGNSPLHRMANVLRIWEEDYIIRITHDDMLIDKQTMVDAVKLAEKEGAGYVISPSIVEGAGVEVISRENLLAAADAIKEPIEHISYYVKDGPNRKVLQIQPRLSVCRPYRLTLDYPQDVFVLETLMRSCPRDATLDDHVAFLDRNPYLMQWNRLPEVSVYTCVRNGAKHLRAAMLSVLNNSFKDFEYIIVDDHSSDKTLLEIAKFPNNDKIRLVLMNHENVGLASASNMAISHARGKYVIRVDADDVILPEGLNLMLRVIKETQAAVVYPGCDEVDEDGKQIRYSHPGENHHAGCALMDRRLLNEVRFRDGLKHWDSLELFQRLSNRFRMAELTLPCFLYRQHDKSLSKSDLKERERIKNEIQALR